MMMLDGPRAPAAAGKANMLVALLHGYGSNGADLISLAPYWAQDLPNAAFVAPNAPEPVPGAPGGYQWWDLARRADPLAMEQGAKAAAGALERYLGRELERLQLEPTRLALVGFSQGTMMSLYVGPRRQVAPLGIVGFSGMLIGGEKLKEEAKSKPPILLVHGDRDDRIPLGAMFQAGDALCEAGLSVQWHVSYGVPHSIGPDGLELAGAFLRTVSKGFSLTR